MKIIETLSTFTGNLTQVIAEKVYALTNIDDISIITFISVFLISYFVFFITTKFAPVFSEIKASILVSIFFSFIIKDTGNILKDIENINSYGIGIFALISIFTFFMIMDNAYYEGLFGRFKEGETKI